MLFLRHGDAIVFRLVDWSFDLLPAKIANEVTLLRRLEPAAPRP